MSAKLSALDPDVRVKAEQFLMDCANASILLRVTQTYRTPEEQAAIYAQGRTTPGQIVTHAPPGYSWHEWRRAFDVCQAGRDPYPDDEAFWDKVGGLAESVGLEWGGRWKHPDRPHMQDTGGMTLATLRAARDETQA